MAKLIKHKWIVFAILLVMVVVLDNLVYNVSIGDRGIVVGLGVDVEGDDLVISAQIMLQKNGGIGGGGNNFVVVTDKEKTLKGALDRISDKLGMSVSEAHSVALVFSQEVFTTGRISLLEDFLIDDEVSEVVSVIMVEGSAKELLESNVTHGETAAFQLERMLQAVKKPLGTNRTTLKSFVVDYRTPNKACFMPIAHSQAAPPNSDQSKAGKTEGVELIINRTAVITKGGEVSQLTQLANEGLSIMTEDVRSGSILITGDEGNHVGVNILKINSQPTFNLDDRTVTFAVKINCMREGGRIGRDGLTTYLLSDSEKESLTQEIDRRLQMAYAVAVEQNADFLGVYNGFYRKYGNNWVNFASRDYLSQIKLVTKVDINQR